MDHGQGLASIAHASHKKFLAGSVIVSLGIVMAAGGGTWDITNHLLNKPETFFAPPHLLLYSGVGAAVAGAVMVATSPRPSGKIVWPVKTIVAGVALLVSAGPVDFAWHSAYGLDGLLSPPHFVLVSGMVASSFGGLGGMVHYKVASLRPRQRIGLHPLLVIAGILPLWISLSGVVEMFTLPFSETRYFDFDPDPALAVAVASTAFPFVIAACLCAASTLSGRRFGVMSLSGAAFIVTSMLGSIVPADMIHSTIPFYALNIIPIVAADAVMSYRFWRPFAFPVYAAGAILGMTFFTMYYPLIAHTYNEYLGLTPLLWPSLTMPTYFEMTQEIYPLLVIPSAALGVVGAIAAGRVVPKGKLL